MWRYNTTFLTGISPLFPGSSYFLLRPTIPFFLYPPLLACGAGFGGSNNSLSELFGELFPNCSGNCFCSFSGIVSRIVFGAFSGSRTFQIGGFGEGVGRSIMRSTICSTGTGTTMISGSVVRSAGGRTCVCFGCSGSSSSGMYQSVPVSGSMTRLLQPAGGLRVDCSG